MSLRHLKEFIKLGENRDLYNNNPDDKKCISCFGSVPKWDNSGLICLLPERANFFSSREDTKHALILELFILSTVKTCLMLWGTSDRFAMYEVNRKFQWWQPRVKKQHDHYSFLKESLNIIHKLESYFLSSFSWVLLNLYNYS